MDVGNLLSCSSWLFWTMKIVRYAADLHNPSLRYRNTVAEIRRTSKCSDAGLLDVVIFVMEARRQDGGFYPPNSLFNVVAGVQGRVD